MSVNPPADDNGKVYLQTVNNGGDTFLWAYDSGSGTQIFKSGFGAQWERYFSPTIVDGVLFIWMAVHTAVCTPSTH